MNEETIIQNPQRTNIAENTQPVDEQKKGEAWKHVVLGGVPGILMGAGMMYATTASAQEQPELAEGENAAENETEQAPEDNVISGDEAVNAATPSTSVASPHNDMSFGQAFAAARAEVGPGGVFYWHGGIYNTYTAEEWAAMSTEQKNDFAMRVRPEIHPSEVPTPTDAHPEIAVHHTEVKTPETEDVQIVTDQHEQPASYDSDVHIVGYTNVEGHLTVGLDTDGDGQADVAIIDVDDDQKLSAPDIILDDQGHIATMEDVANGMQTYADDPSDTSYDQPMLDI